MSTETTRIEPSPIDQKQKLNTLTTVVLIFLHIGAVAALFQFSWLNLDGGLPLLDDDRFGHQPWISPAAYPSILQSPGVSGILFAVCGALTLEGGPIFWVATHRVHHQFSDKAGDPHSPNDGAWWSHVGWILLGEAKHNNTKLNSKYAPDLAKHKFYVWLNDYHWVPNVVLGLALVAIGGVSMMLWGFCLRVVVGLHSTWLVNSATHMWGSRRFSTRGQFAEQLVGRSTDVRRGLAQQSPCASDFGASWIDLV